MIDTEALWARVLKGTPNIRSSGLEDLLAFLNTVECAHAKLLTGRTPCDNADESSARHLEAAVVEHVRLGNATRATAAQWLRWLHVAFKLAPQFLAAGHAQPDIHPTRLALLPRPATSPFSPAFNALVIPVLTWEKSLSSWLASLKDQELQSPEWVAGLVLSAVLNGGLLAAPKVKSLLDQVYSGELPAIGNRPYVEFHQSMGRFGDFHCQRWFLDPVSELLLFRKPADLKPLTSRQLTQAIQALLHSHGTPTDALPGGLSKLIVHATARWYQQAARVDIEIISRKVPSHAFAERTWKRLFKQQPTAADVASRAENPFTSDTEPEFRADFCLLHPWFPVLCEALTLPPKADPASVNVLERLAASGFSDSTLVGSHKLFVAWVIALLTGKNCTHDRLAVSTIKRLSEAVIPAMISRLQGKNPLDLTPVDFVEIYERIVEGAQERERLTLAQGLREFHHYLHQSHGIPSLKSIRDTLGDDVGLEPVDANPISVEEYHRARGYLDRQIRRGGDSDLLLIAKLIMTLAFRTGMRRREAMGLRLMDVSDGHGLHIIIRPHEERQLKSDASQRIVPARFLIPLKERRELQAWLERRFQGADLKDDSAWVFDVPTADGGWRRLSAETTADRIIEALSYATGQPTKIHQLRHSFGTWTYLALRTPDYPEVLQLFDHLPQTQMLLKRGRRLRQLLLNRPGPTSRSYGYVVARLLGHSSPLVSLNHYIHSTEFIHRAMSVRRADQLPAAALRGVANLKPAWGNRLLESGVEHLLDHLRRQAAKSAQAALVNLVQTPANHDTQVNLAVTQTATKKKGRPETARPSDWVSLMTVHELLHMYASTNESLEGICDQLDLKVSAAQRIIDSTLKIGEEVGFKLSGVRPLAFPAFVRTQAATSLAAALEAKLAWAFAKDQAVAMKGTWIHLNHYNPSKRDVVFKGERETEALQTYVCLLDLMKFTRDDVQILLRTARGNKIPSWSVQILKQYRRSAVIYNQPPVPSKASSYRNWLGLRMTSGEQSGWPNAARAMMFLAHVSQTNSLI